MPISSVGLLVYILGTIAVSTLVDLKGGKIREERKKATIDGKESKAPLSWMDSLLLDMTETEFPIYKPGYLYWDAVIMIRKLLLGIVISFASHIPQTQCVLLIMIFIISLIVQNKKRPYYKDKINDLEETSLVAGSMVLLVGLVASAKETTDPAFVFFLGLMIISFICGSGVLMCWNILYHWYLSVMEAQGLMRKKLQKSLGSLSNVARQSMRPQKVVKETFGPTNGGGNKGGSHDNISNARLLAFKELQSPADGKLPLSNDVKDDLQSPKEDIVSPGHANDDQHVFEEGIIALKTANLNSEEE